MTSEVMLMNLEAIAFSADSAVTLLDYSNRGVRMRTQTGVEKIFTIDEKLPVAGLIYGNGTFSGAPWSNVFEAFKLTVPRAGQSVEDVTRGLLAFLAAARPIEENASVQLPMLEEADEYNFFRYVYFTIARLETLVEEHTNSSPTRSADDAFRSALDELEKESRFTVGYIAGDIASPQDDATARPIVGASTQQLVKLVHAYLDQFISDSLEAKQFKRMKGFPASLKSRLREVIVTSLLTDWIPPGLPTTGIVVAGFSSNRVQPSFEHVDVFGAMGGVLKHARIEYGGPSQRQEPVIVRSFAQDDAITAFLFGARDAFIGTAYYAALSIVARARNELVRKIAANNRAMIAEIDNCMELAAHSSLIGMLHAQDSRRSHVRDTMDSLLSACSAEPLAQHAENLLQLEILEHELGGEPTVGRPISLVAMSKGHLRRWHA